MTRRPAVLPREPGVFWLVSPDGREHRVRVKDYNGVLYAIRGWLLFPVAIPVDRVKGAWVTR